MVKLARNSGVTLLSRRSFSALCAASYGSRVQKNFEGKEAESSMPKVLIIQSEMKHYRLPFFTGLHEALRRDGIELTVAYSNSHPKHASRGDSVELPPEIAHKVPGRWFFGRLLYQPLWKEIMASDLVITGSEIKYLTNPILLLMSRLGLKTVAFWGLGPNRHPDRSPIAEWVKARMFTQVDWWFAYTRSVAEYLEGQGMLAERITVVQNSTTQASFADDSLDIGRRGAHRQNKANSDPTGV